MFTLTEHFDAVLPLLKVIIANKWLAAMFEAFGRGAHRRSIDTVPIGVSRFGLGVTKNVASAAHITVGNLTSMVIVLSCHQRVIIQEPWPG